MRRRSEQGFSVIETLVSMAILSVALLTLLNAKSQISREAARQRNHEIQALATENALVIMRDVNPMREVVGERRFGDRSIMTWRARLTSPVVRSVGVSTPDGDFDVGLFRVDIEVTHADLSPTRFTIEQVGWARRLGIE